MTRAGILFAFNINCYPPGLVQSKGGIINIMASIWNLLKRRNTPSGSGHNLQKPAQAEDKNIDANSDKSLEPEPGFDFLDGMSTGTAKFIIDREVNPTILEKYNIK
jgi:hypothetical protein